MTDAPTTALLLAASALWGLALGGAYFAALGWTVRRLPGARRPGLLLLASFLVRSGLLLAGLAVVLDGRWERAAAFLAGFLAARTLALRRSAVRPGRTGGAA